MTRTTNAVDQRMLRMYLSLSATYLVMDSSTNTESGIASWFTGFNRLVEVMIALHKRGELDVETVDAASKACSECWSVAGSWRGLSQCRERVRDIAEKLKTLLDENGRTYQGQSVYVP